MRKIQSDECKKEIFIIESKVDKENVKSYIDIATDLRKRNCITKNNFKDLRQRFIEKWVCYDALAYAEDYNDIVKKHKNIIDQNPWGKYRIVKANCIYHNEYGISVVNFNYEITKIYFKRLTVIFHIQLQKIKLSLIMIKHTKERNEEIVKYLMASLTAFEKLQR